jgi:hypothetical protein
MFDLLRVETGADEQCEIVGSFIDKFEESSMIIGETREKALFGLAIAHGLDVALDCAPLRSDGLKASGGAILPELHEKLKRM